MVVWYSGKGKTREAGNDQRSRVVVRKMDRRLYGSATILSDTMMLDGSPYSCLNTQTATLGEP